MASFYKIMARLHSVFDKTPHGAPLFKIQNWGYLPYKVTFSPLTVIVESESTRKIVSINWSTTMEDLINALASVTDLHFVIDSEYLNSLVIAIPEDSVVIPPDYTNKYVFAENGIAMMTEDGQPIEMEG